MSRASHLQAFADQNPSNPILLCDLLDELLTEERVGEALARLHAAPAELRALTAVTFREARCAMLRRDFAGVVALLQPLMAAPAGVPAGLAHDLAYAQLALGLSDQALQTLASVDTQGEDADAVALLKARILHHQQRFEAALEVLAQISVNSRPAEAQGLRALLLLDKGDTTGAAAEAATALRADPTQYEAAIALGNVALLARHLDTSQAAFEQVLVRHPHSGRALLGLGQNLMLRGDVPAARAALERSVANMPDHIGTWHALAWCQLLEGDLAGARQSFEKAYAIDRTFGETHGGFALVHALRSERKEAEESIKRAMRLDPNGSAVRYAQSVLLLDDGHAEEAQKIADGILAKSPDHAVAMPADFVFRLRELVRPRG